MKTISCILLFLICMPLHSAAVQAGTLVKVGVYDNKPLLFSDEGGRPRGVFADIIEHIAGRESWQIEYVAGTFAQCLSMLQSRKIDLLCPIAYSAERATQFDFTRENLLTNWGQIYTLQDHRIYSIADLHSKRVAVLKEDIHYDAFKQLLMDFGIDCNFVELDDYQSVLQSINQREVDAGIVNRFFGMQFGPAYEVDNSSIIFNPIKIHFAAPRGFGKELLAVIDRHVVTMKRDNQSLYYRSLDKWLGNIPESRRMPQWGLWIFWVTVMVLLFLFAGNLILRTQIKKQTKNLTAELALRERIEEDLRATEERLHAILQANPDPMVIYDTVGFPEYINPAFTQIFGWTLQEVKGAHIPFVPEDQQMITSNQIKEIYQTEKPVLFETQRLTKDGRILSVIVSAALIKKIDTDPPIGMIVNLTDITERKLLEAQYEQAQRMESIGTLAGGIAHDFNNLLMGIQGRVSLINGDLEKEHPLHEHTKEIGEYVRSAADLTKQLLGFARGGKYEVKPLDVNDLVKHSSNMFRRTRKEIAVVSHLTQDPAVVEADRRQIEHVLLNIYVNAWQAMPGGGTLTLSTSRVSLDEQTGRSRHVEPGEFVKISISDTGTGIEEAVQHRIFDPFFTTKDKDRGTGLGLASAYGIIRNHSGFISVSSKVGQGTTFHLYLPATDKAPYCETTTLDEPIRGNETILLVDDEEMILDVGQAMLDKLGYSVLVSRSGREAIETVRSGQWSIDLIILDLIMPELDGGATFDQIKTIAPDMRVLLSSGYAINGQAEAILKRGCNGFIQKPFNIFELSKKLREILDRQLTDRG